MKHIVVACSDLDLVQLLLSSAVFYHLVQFSQCNVQCHDPRDIGHRLRDAAGKDPSNASVQTAKVMSNHPQGVGSVSVMLLPFRFGACSGNDSPPSGAWSVAVVLFHLHV